MDVFGFGSTIMPSEKYWEKIRAEWERFIKTGRLDRNILRPVIASSWERCRQKGVDPYLKKVTHKASEAEMEERFRKSQALLETSRPILANLYNSIREMELVIALMDKEGFVLEIMGEGLIKELFDKVELKPGTFWTEESSGTTAPSVALHIGKPVQVVAEEHYAEIAKGATCAAAPIFGKDGKIEGILDISALYEVAGAHLHTFGMALAAAKAIETALWSRSVSEQLDVSYRYFDAAVESLSDGLIVLDQNLKVLRINRLAAKVTGLHVGDNLALSVKDGLFLEKVIRSLENCGGFQGQEVAFLHQGGVQRLIVDGEPILDGQGKRLGMILTLFEMRRARKLAHRIYGARAVYRFEDLIGEDPEFKKCVETLRKASRADCPIILYGESGTGKEMCAQAVHNFSTRRDGPFIPINCAAIPRDLLESELFGYEEGAFTGARKGGNPGKFELADGGTLFLDEIDSMPLELQAKLLRIVEEKRVLRLGGKNFLPVDVRIIAASCKDLLYKILEGKFREDLYYRLSVVEVHLPPLRERREDILLLARHFLQRYAKSPEDVESHLQPRILQALQAYDWPGNIRELSNWVERMLTIGAGETMEAKIARYPLRDRVEHESENAEVVESSRRLEEIEASHIEQVLERNRYNITKTAAELGISRPTLYRKMGKYRIQFERPFARQEAIIRPGPNR